MQTSTCRRAHADEHMRSNHRPEGRPRAGLGHCEHAEQEAGGRRRGGEGRRRHVLRPLAPEPATDPPPLLPWPLAPEPSPLPNGALPPGARDPKRCARAPGASTRAAGPGPEPAERPRLGEDHGAERLRLRPHQALALRRLRLLALTTAGCGRIHTQVPTAGRARAGQARAARCVSREGWGSV
jgi:hypothetical protein